MEPLSGLETAFIIRQKESLMQNHLRIPIIALTANMMEGLSKEYRDAGIDLYLSKPIRIAALFQCIESVYRLIGRIGSESNS